MIKRGLSAGRFTQALVARIKDVRTFLRRRLVIVAVCLVVLAAFGTAVGIVLTKGSSASAAGSRASHFAALRSCLQKQGITLPSFGSRPSGGSGFSPGSSEGSPGYRGGFQLPEGESASKLREAMKKCGARSFPGGAGSHYEGGSPLGGSPYGAPNGEPPTSSGEGSSSGATSSEPSTSSS